jgi:hypothetical protein
VPDHRSQPGVTPSGDRAIGDLAALLAAIDEGKVEDDPKYGF